MKWSRCN